MCARTDAANELRDAARCLSRACYAQTLRGTYEDTVREGVPYWAQALLNRLK
jgi:hypothetical protein